MHRIEAMFTDGGLIAPNPSPHGIAWAAVIVMRHAHTGKIETAETSRFGSAENFGLPTVENNLAETVAIVHGLEFLDSIRDKLGELAKNFTVYGDNENAIRRARDPYGAKFGGVQPRIRERLQSVVSRFPHIRYELIGGSMAKGDIDRGYREDGKTVSRYNVRADYLCRLELFRASLRLGLIDVDSTYPRPKVKCDGVDLIPAGFAEEIERVRDSVRRELANAAKSPNE